MSLQRRLADLERQRLDEPEPWRPPPEVANDPAVQEKARDFLEVVTRVQGDRRRVDVPPPSRCLVCDRERDDDGIAVVALTSAIAVHASCVPPPKDAA